MVLLLFLLLFLVPSCSSNPNGDEFDDIHNENTEEPASGIPAINTSEEFVISYNAYSNKNLTGSEAIAVDMRSFLWDTYWKCRSVQAYQSEYTGGSVIKVDNSLSFRYGYQLYFPGMNYLCESYEYRFEGYTAMLGNQTIQVWGTAKYSERADEEPVEGTINEFTIVETDWFDCDLVIKVNDDVFSFKSDYLDTTGSLFKGTATINGVDYKLNLSV